MQITGIYRYPVKGFSPEALAVTDLQAGATIAHDRAYAVENGPTGFDPANPTYFPKIRFLMLMRNESVARLTTRFDPATTLWRIEEAGRLLIEGRLDRTEDRAAIEAFLNERFAGELRGPARILAGEGHSFSDVSKKVLHLVNLASVRDLERHIGRAVDPLRFRANLYVDGIPAWSEFDLVAAELSVGEVVLKGTKRTERCAATNVDPVTAERDLTIPRSLMELYGHMDCGIYVEVLRAGRIAVGDALALRQPGLDV